MRGFLVTEGVGNAETDIGRYHDCEAANVNARHAHDVFRRDRHRRWLTKADTEIPRRRGLCRR